MFRRDVSRLKDAYLRADECPLGAGALAATTYPLDRVKVAGDLGFSRVTQNSLDTVSDRDFIVELIFVNSLIMAHLSRFCEEIVYWASAEFKFIEIDDAFATGSSIMPQKKNPDMAELIRGKTGRVYGDLMGILTVIKGLPLSYNTDLQEDKERLFDACDSVSACLEIFDKMIASVKFNTENMRRAAAGGFSAATDAADFLVKKGAAFRDAHEIVGKLVLYCIDANKSLDELSLEEYKNFSPLFDNDIFSAVDLNNVVKSRNIIGGPGY
jgi:argininosuccinate lyase